MMRSALVTIALAVLTLLLSLAALLSIQMQQASGAERQQLVSGFSSTLTELDGLVDSTEKNWAQSDELARLIAVADVQTNSLSETPGWLSATNPESLDTAAEEFDADWLMLRESLLSAPPESVEALPTPATPEVTVVGDVSLLARDFSVIQTRVFEGTQSAELRNLANQTSSNWQQLEKLSANDADILNIIDQQKNFAQDLVRLSGVESDNSLFGYNTKNLITSYVSQLNQLEASIEVTEGTSSIASTSPPTRLLIKQQITQVENSVESFQQQSELISLRLSRAMWFAIGGLFVSLLLCLLAAAQMLRTSRNLNQQATHSNDPVPADSLSAKQSSTLVGDIESLADGDLRYLVRVPDYGPARDIAESVNRSGAVTHKLVTMTRGVAERLAELVKQHNTLGQRLGGIDINRQAQTAELSDAIALRSRLIGEQQSLVVNIADIAKDIRKNSEGSATTANNVSSQFATASAQIEVGSERMQRLLKTAHSVTAAINTIKQLSEQTRLQALNASLQMLETDSLSAATEYENDTADIDGIHLLTGRMVQAASDADKAVVTLQNDISETAEALASCQLELKESANTGFANKREGKELDGQISAIESIVANALDKLEQQKNELSQSAEGIVSLDKTGNSYSHLTMTLTQDIAELESMGSKLEESVAGFRLPDSMRRETALER